MHHRKQITLVGKTMTNYIAQTLGKAGRISNHYFYNRTLRITFTSLSHQIYLLFPHVSLEKSNQSLAPFTKWLKQHVHFHLVMHRRGWTALGYSLRNVWSPLPHELWSLILNTTWFRIRTFQITHVLSAPGLPWTSSSIYVKVFNINSLRRIL